VGVRQGAEIQKEITNSRRVEDERLYRLSSRLREQEEGAHREAG